MEELKNGNLTLVLSGGTANFGPVDEAQCWEHINETYIPHHPL